MSLAARNRPVDGTVIAPPAVWRVPPNLADPDAARATFVRAGAHAGVEGLPGGRGVNLGHECVDRHARVHPGRAAFRYVDRAGGRSAVTYGQLRDRTNRFANALAGLGVAPGECVVALLGRTPELHMVVLGALKHRAVAATLFASYGPDPIRERLALTRAAVLVTTGALYRRKVAPVRDRLPDLRRVLIVGTDVPEGTVALDTLLRRAGTAYEIGPTDPADAALLHVTSGTTGPPKAAVHVHGAVAALRLTARWALDLRERDVFWCTADPGWVTGTSYGILAPLALGVTSVVDEADFDAERWYRILRDERVSVWYTAPTALRMLMRLGTGVAREYAFDRLRFVASVGEPLEPSAVRWGLEAFGLPIHDTWWQTETGTIMIANLAAEPIHPGSMGRPLPGVTAAVLRRDERGRVVVRDGEAEVVTEPREAGELALRPGWPAMFRGYLHDSERTARCFAGGWYLTGDLARRDADGRYWFVGRGDDVIKTGGHLVGPAEVERALAEHPAVAEAAAIGVPDPVLGAAVKAIVVLRPGHEPGEALARDLIGFTRRRLGPTLAPRTVAFAASLPRTRSGKVVRRVLRARDLGLPEGDTSALEDAP